MVHHRTPDDPRNPDDPRHPYQPARTGYREGFGALPVVAGIALLAILALFVFMSSDDTPGTSPVAEQTRTNTDPGANRTPPATTPPATPPAQKPTPQQ